ncbi:MAG: carboxypeptidase-like regulatory domain-containing protein [Betaproteobacteria bacterium]
MKKVLIAALIVAAAALFAMPAATASQSDSMTMDTSQSYLRLGFDDAITITLHLSSGMANVPIVMKFRTGDDYVIFDKAMVVTDGTGTGYNVMRLNPENPPERLKLPMQVMVEATVIGNDAINAFTMLYITSTGAIKGYVIDDEGSTITGAEITVTMPDGTVFPGGPFKSNDETPMGFYRIDNLPILPTGRDTLTATKGGYTGTCQVEPGYENIQNDVTINGYRDTIDIPSIVTGNANNTVSPVPASIGSETPTRPTTMTTTILIAIALITLVYIGLKAYRRMF